MNTVSVTELNNQIKAILESTFERVSVEGEVSNITYHGSGHLYFTIKDENSSIRCVMFRGNAARLKFRIERGMHIVCEGAISLYTPRGEYQLNCFSVTPAGEGALALAYEQLKKQLAAKGYFDESIKKPLPKVPKKIAIVTSGTGAAIQDMLKVARKRWNLLKIVLIDTIVQGDAAAPQLASNIAYADTLGCDVIVVGRGGGSIEDLWGFNEAIVADAIFKANTPVVSAVGHEVDFVISDFVADKRAATPSAAMEILLPDQTEVLYYLDTVAERFNTAMKTLLDKKQDALGYLKSALVSRSMSAKISMMLKEAAAYASRLKQFHSYFIQAKVSALSPLESGMQSRGESFFRAKEYQLTVLAQRMADADPSARLLPHTAQVVREGKSVSLNELNVGETFRLVDGKTVLESKALKKEILE